MWAITIATTGVTSALLDVAGIPCVLVEGNRLYLTNHTFRIDPGCTGVTWLVLYAITVLLMPVSAMRKIQGLLVGLPTLVAFNFVRLVMVAAVSEHWPLQFFYIHDKIMQGAFVGVTVLLWAGWMFLSRNDWKPGWE